jgi:lipopolysaccharide export system permease protein
MKIIYRSILKELVFTFLLSLTCLNFILMMEKLLKLSRLLSGVGSSVADMIKLILYLQPTLFLLTIPMALLLSTLLVYGRLNLDNELIVLRTSGMTFFGICMPVFMLGLFCFFLNTAISFYIGPKSSMLLREEITQIIKVRTPLAIEEGRFTTTFRDVLILIKEKTPDNVMKDIFIYDSRSKNEPRVLFAKEGQISLQDGMDLNLFLKDGYINMVKGDTTTEMTFSKYNMMLKFEIDSPSRRNTELTPPELLDEIKDADPRYAGALYTEFYRRLTLPFLCIVLVFFGPPLSMVAGKSGRLGGLTLGLAVFTLYYMVLIYIENLVKSGNIPHYSGAFIPTLILAFFAAVAFRQESNR